MKTCLECAEGYTLKNGLCVENDDDGSSAPSENIIAVYVILGILAVVVIVLAGVIINLKMRESSRNEEENRNLESAGKLPDVT